MNDVVKCTMLPLSKEQNLLLPSNSLAEVVKNRSDMLVMGAREGVIGKIQWRGRSVPLVSYEATIGHAIPSYGREACIAVVFTPSGDASLPYIAFNIQGSPKLVDLADTDVVSVEGEEHALLSAHVEIDGAKAFIPNLQALEPFVKMRVN
jgi:chemosensory pili system protein ChpC